ncbi:MAG: helix-turn-helix transcriptional regulator, partial [Candidatus Tectomicrobia bacterium]|nr:helix-turn-helix transcriptional regulator [Candidatus Tectomicrobia bacterium]
FTGNTLTVATHSVEDARVYLARTCYRGQHRPDLEYEYFTVYYPLDERVPRFRALPDSEVVLVTNLYTNEELRASPTYNEALPRYGAQNALNVRLDGPDGANIAWEIVASVDPHGWGSVQVEMVRRVLPHIRQFVRVRHALFKAGVLGASAAQFLGSTWTGVVYVDWKGRILETNDRALNLLRRAEGLLDQAGFLRTQLPADNARLQNLLARAVPSFGKPALSGSMTVWRPSGMPRLVLHVNPVPSDHGADGIGPIAALVLISEPGSLPHIDPDLVAAALDLTPAESRVAVMLAEGRAVREIAAYAGCQVNTIQFHIKQIHHKLGISVRGELVRLVLSLAGSPDFLP